MKNTTKNWKEKPKKRTSLDITSSPRSDSPTSQLQPPQSSSGATASNSLPEAKALSEIAQLNSLSIRYTKFKTILESQVIDLENLKKLSWSGIPEEIRATVWKLLLGYLPTNIDRRNTTLDRKRAEYNEYISQTFGDVISSATSNGDNNSNKVNLDKDLYHQIHIDIQRTNSNILLYQDKKIQQSLERILYCWAIRHPASGYVQGINDLVTPFFQVFLSEFINIEDDGEIESLNMLVLGKVEADAFWCLTKLLDGIQDNYTFSQPGIQRQVLRLKELIQRIDAPLAQHLNTQGIEFIQFSFRWMNCLLMREVSILNTIRMWDTYLAEGTDGFSDFHLYVCAAFLVKWSDRLKAMEFQDIMVFLQDLPTKGWTDKEVELLLSEAFMWKSLFGGSQAHLV